MWLAEAVPSADSASLWLAVSALITALGGVAIAVITVRGRGATSRGDVSKAGDEAVREYRKKFVVPEMERLQARVTRAEDRAEKFRRGWDECERQRLSRLPPETGHE